MSMDLSTMLHSQCEIQGRIARSVENLKKMGISNITLSANETHVKIMDQLCTKFEAQYDLIFAGYKDKFDESEYTNSDLFDITENTYVIQKSTLAEYGTKPLRQHRLRQVGKAAIMFLRSRSH
ncbi:unnamed protein product [Lasius platythorax]|uniref:Uncharacterized protein n=1 Tax=Lasius platythorax TaxID=488582 RepID=A0AAV2NNH9_9HYME